MSEAIEFVNDWFAEVESVPGRMRQVAFRKGAKLQVEIHPIEEGTMLLADLGLEDGSIARHVPCAYFTVVGKGASVPRTILRRVSALRSRVA